MTDTTQLETNEAQIETDTATLEADLKAQPNNYALHVKLIKTLTKESGKLQSAREAFAERFPLTS